KGEESGPQKNLELKAQSAKETSNPKVQRRGFTMFNSTGLAASTLAKLVPKTTFFEDLVAHFVAHLIEIRPARQSGRLSVPKNVLLGQVLVSRRLLYL